MYIRIYKAGKVHLNADSEAKLKAFCPWLCVSACAWGFGLRWVLTAVMLFGLLIFLWNTTVIHGHISEARGPSLLAVLLKSTFHCPISSVHSNPPPSLPSVGFTLFHAHVWRETLVKNKRKLLYIWRFGSYVSDAGVCVVTPAHVL